MRFRYFDLSKGVDGQLVPLEEFDPTLLFAPPSALLKVARAKREGRLRLPSLERILTGAEATDPTDGTRIETAFGLRPFQIYQCTEGFLAASCSAGAIHLNEDAIFFEREYLDSERSRFAPIITDLRRRGQPYVRYRMTDVLLDLPPADAARPCPCGSAFARIHAITGREEDLIRVGGRIVFHDEIAAIFHGQRDHFEEYQAIQTGGDEIEVRLSGASDSIRPGIATALKELFQARTGIVPRFRFAEFHEGPPEVKLRRIQNLSGG
jgi:putative adenylate-forming enzyme